MPKYIVINPIKSGGQRHMPGAEVEIDAKTAKALLDGGDIRAAAENGAAEKAAAEKAAAEEAAAEKQNNPESEAQAAGDQEEKAEGAGATAEAGTASQPAGKKKGAK